MASNRYTLHRGRLRPLRGRTALRMLAMALPAIAACTPVSGQDLAAGQRLFQQRCASCHSVQPGQNRLGPHLAGIVGRPVASVPDARYSAALRAANTDWDEALLDRFLARPAQAFPGTTMGVGVPDAAQRAAILDYLKSL